MEFKAQKPFYCIITAETQANTHWALIMDLAFDKYENIGGFSTVLLRNLGTRESLAWWQQCIISDTQETMADGL